MTPTSNASFECYNISHTRLHRAEARRFQLFILTKYTIETELKVRSGSMKINK